ncbi:MAG: hypothetical protein M0R40_00125 [Firmicutes bacterium]|nr:hypothetical protein [Bacillota bacterium]
MYDFKLSNVDDVVLVTIENVPNSTFVLADIFEKIADSHINVDMISQTAPYKDTTDLSFTIDAVDLTKTFSVVGEIKKQYPKVTTEISPGNCKFMIYSELLKSQYGIAARLFKALSDNGFQIKLITTSDMEISILLDKSEFEKIGAVLKQEFLY